MAKQIAKQVEATTAPFQYALSTRAGCECVAHILQSITDEDPDATVVSIDGVGAYDLISRKAMLEGLLRMEGGDKILPCEILLGGFQRQFLPPICGRTNCRAPPSISHEGEKGASKATHSCRCCSHWRNTVGLWRFRSG